LVVCRLLAGWLPHVGMSLGLVTTQSMRFMKTTNR
jgi:hypothetical protein